jgi:hypothetical protein
MSTMLLPLPGSKVTRSNSFTLSSMGEQIAAHATLRKGRSDEKYGHKKT